MKKMITKMFFNKLVSELEKEKEKPKTRDMYLDLFNSGIIVDIEKIRKTSIDVAIRVVKRIENEIARGK